MKLLLDTHVWLWLNLEPARLPARFAAAIADPENEILVSVASVWEVSIKEKLGKISVGGPFLLFVERPSRRGSRCSRSTRSSRATACAPWTADAICRRASRARSPRCSPRARLLPYPLAGPSPPR